MRINKINEYRESMIPNVFKFWLENYASSSKSTMKFDTLLEKLGLLEQEKVSSVETNNKAKRAIDRAEQIKKMDVK